MRNPVNRLATAAPRAFDSILKQPTPTTSSTTTTTTANDSTNTQERRGRSASFHVDLSVLLHSSNVEGAGVSPSNVDTMASVGDETGSVLTFDAAMDIIPWGWNEESEVGL